MSVTTAWQTVNDGEITSLDLSGVPSLDWVKIRWRGKRYKDTQTISQDYTLTDQDGVNEIKHDPPPEVPLGRNFEKYYISSQMTFNDGQPHHYVLSQYDMDIGHIIDRVRSLEDGEESSITLTNFYYEETSEIWTDGNNNTGHLYELYSLVRLYHYEYLQSENIRSTVDGYTTNGPTLLNNDEISDWETLSGITAGTNNNITHNIDSSET
ncbi:MAG TPA: hypothetical protein VJ877_00120, partial [Bacteroidales bacterium]|nr:hypothetical protein [Bacteroidales bacterium]